jgi:hypothetical protein
MFKKMFTKIGAFLTLGAVTVVNAASVALPATAQADMEGSVTNGGEFYITVTLLILGFIVIGSMIKRSK